MNEEAFLESILGIAGDQGYDAAYRALNEALPSLGEPSPQVLYFLSCFAGGAGHAALALKHLSDAIEVRGYWYRAEMLEDDDLACIKEDPRFQALSKRSVERHDAAQAAAKPVFTWKAKLGSEILVVLHGNGQSAETALSDWSQLQKPGLDIAAVQSSTVDGFGGFRWNYDDTNYLDFVNAIAPLRRERYQKTSFAGFSAGCDMLLRAILHSDVRCHTLLLQSPYIPLIETEALPDLMNGLREKVAELRIFCGEFDEDCLPLAETLFYAAADAGLNASFRRQPGLRHQFPTKMGAEYQI